MYLASIVRTEDGTPWHGLRAVRLETREFLALQLYTLCCSHLLLLLRLPPFRLLSTIFVLMTAADWKHWLDTIKNADDEAALEALEQDLFGRKQGAMTLALKELGKLDQKKREKEGAALNKKKQELQEALDKRRSALQEAALADLDTTDRLDMTLEVPVTKSGRMHPITSFMRDIEHVFSSLGFDIAEGNEIETDEANFGSLNFAEDHPARDMHDTFWLMGNEKLLLRTHTSPVQVHYLREHTPPLRMICPGKVYRRDSDATHSPMFHQCEGLMIDTDVSIAHMKGVMETAIRSLLSPDITFRFRTSYFPFVEPGLEVDIRWKSHGKEERWLEVAGCGMVHPNVLRDANIDPEKYQGFAFGFGVERLLMIKHGIPDLRLLYESDPRFLEQF